MSNDWSISEVKVTVEDYFDMLRFELNGLRYNKSEHRRLLLGSLNDRSEGAVEKKRQNISAVLIEMGVPYINGYKPQFNYQRSLLPQVISDYISQHEELHELFSKDTDRIPETPTIPDILAVIESIPKPSKEERQIIAEAPPVYSPTGVNYLEREAHNQKLGEAGEQLILNFERARLFKEGKEALADKVEQVSRTEGPGAGYDIHSYEATGKDRFIEGKTTKYGISTPFFITPNELKFASLNKANYFLYRVFNYSNNPRMYIHGGYLEPDFQLRATQYLAKPT